MKIPVPWMGYGAAIGMVAICTALGFAMTPRFDIVNIAMVYLLSVVLAALYLSRGAAILTAVLSVAIFDVAFVPPPGTFDIHDLQYLLTFFILLAVALIISGLMERGRQQTREQAKLTVEAETESIRGALLASISHDLRTPLAVLTGASSSLLEAGDRMSADERVALVSSIYERAREMSDQMEKILQMTRIESGVIRLDKDWTAIAEVAGAALERVAGKLAKHYVVVDIPADLPLVRADAALIEQVLLNLLENAARHTPAGTVVQVRAQGALSEGAGPAEMVVSVVDSGPGIPEDEIERLFVKFHRGSVEGAASGIGLGLAICHAIVHLHGGRMWAERLLDGGSAFRFSLPLEKPPAPPVEVDDAVDNLGDDLADDMGYDKR
jgi:two-component system sensor histidine kinase KdpD